MKILSDGLVIYATIPLLIYYEFWWLFFSDQCAAVERKQVACKSLSSSFRVQLGMTTKLRSTPPQSLHHYLVLFKVLQKVFSWLLHFSRIGKYFSSAVVLTNEALQLWLRRAEVARGARMTAQWRRRSHASPEPWELWREAERHIKIWEELFFFAIREEEEERATLETLTRACEGNA